LLAGLEKAKNVEFDFDRFGGGAGVDVGNGAVGAEKAELAVEALDFVQRFLGGGTKSAFAGSVEKDLETGAHGETGNADGLFGGHGRKRGRNFPVPGEPEPGKGGVKRARTSRPGTRFWF